MEGLFMATVLPISIYELCFGIKRYHIDAMPYTFKDNSNQCGAIVTLINPETLATFLGYKITDQIIGIIKTDISKSKTSTIHNTKYRLKSWGDRMLESYK